MGKNKMKILEDYKKIAHELLFEVDDEKMIKYKDKDGESKEMKRFCQDYAWMTILLNKLIDSKMKVMMVVTIKMFRTKF